MSESSNNLDSVIELGPVSTEYVEQFQLTQEQGSQLPAIGVESPVSNEGRADYSALHNWASENFTTQLKALLGSYRNLTESEIAEHGLNASQWSEYRQYTLDSEVVLPGNLTLLPGTFIVDGAKAVRGEMEIRNKAGKSVGIKFSECSGSDYPAYFMRGNPEDKITNIDWDFSGGFMMTAIRDAWKARDKQTNLNKMESVVIGMMQAKNTKAQEEKDSNEKIKDQTRNQILDALSL